MAKHKMVYSTLAVALDAEYRTDDLKKLAALICPKVPTRKTERIEVIVSTLFKDLKNIYGQLSPLGQHAVSESVHTWGGIFEGRMFVNKYYASPYTQSTGSDEQIVNLIYLFLVGGHIPKDLLEKLKDIAPHPPEGEIQYLEGISEEYFFDENSTLRETSRPALENLSTLLNLVADKKIRVSAKTGRATAATVKRINELLYDGDWYDNDMMPMQSFAWPLLLQGGKLAKTDGSFLQLTPAGRKALKKDLAGGIKTAWQRWEKTKIIDEFSRVTAIKGQKSSRGRTMTSPVKRRPMINNLLEDLEPGKWIAVEELDRVMQTTSLYSFNMVNYDWKLYFLDQHYGHLDYNDTWPLLQFRYLLVYLMEYCATLGLIDVVYKEPHGVRSDDYKSCWGTDELPYLSHCDGLEYIRVNELGAYALRHTDTYEGKKNSTDLLAFEKTDLVFTGDKIIPPGLALYLEKVAEQKEVDRWRLSTASLLAAINDGENLADIKKTLASSSMEFSKEIELLFKEVKQRSSAFIDAGTTTLVECSSESRKQALTHKKISRLCLPAGENHLAVLPGKEEAFSKALQTAGFILGQKNI
ncbi:MAG TPA: hypothetical protein ENJ30_12910 [Desulfobulbaceae bacterium]|nr:hypothetical protein [Desulfobulbaceae bacterium]